MKALRNTLIILLGFSPLFAWAKHPIILLIGTPRTGSTSMVRLMDETNLFKTYNEPFLHPHFANNFPRLAKAVYGGTDRTHAEVMAELNAEAEHRPVFVKDMIASLGTYLLEHPEIIKQENIHIRFLVRDAYSSLRSYTNLIDLDQMDLEAMYDYKSLSKLYKLVQKNSPNKTAVIEIEKFTRNFKPQVKKLFKNLGLPAHRINFKFPKRTQEEVAKRLNDSKRADIFDHWHKHASESTKIHPITFKTYKSDGGSTEHPFSWLDNPADQRRLEKVLESSNKHMLPLLGCSIIFY